MNTFWPYPLYKQWHSGTTLQFIGGKNKKIIMHYQTKPTLGLKRSHHMYTVPNGTSDRDRGP